MSEKIEAGSANIVERLRYWDAHMKGHDTHPVFAEAAAEITALRAEVERLREVLKLARRAIGDHHAPNDCYATGPLTGDDYRDLVECPACAFLAALEAKP